LVWKAISSITLMIFEIFTDEPAISPMALTACDTTRPLCWALDLAVSTTVFAWPALSEAERTDAVSCSIAAAVCSSVAACFWVRADRSDAAALILATSPRIERAFSITDVMAAYCRSSVRLKSRCKTP
jgi:hypothetical protein